jgi:transposase
VRYCPGCFEKQRKIDALQEEIVRIKTKLHHQERTAREGYFGSSTPSSKIPIKPNTLAERQQRRGGACVGHPGHGRRSVERGKADRTERVAVGRLCPRCGALLKDRGIKRRTVTECIPIKMEKVEYELERRYCAHCAESFNARPPGVMPKCLYGNKLFTHVAIQHYLHGNPLGQLERQTGIGYGSLVDAMHQLARRLKGVPEKLIQEYQRSVVKHADETGWRNDGQNGYGWLFCTPDISIFRFRKSRSARIAHEVLGEKALPGVLVVDRYNAYNKIRCSIQYCYAHLLRTVKDIEQEFPDNPEIHCFVETFSSLLSRAIHLRTLNLAEHEFKRHAEELKEKIIAAVHHEANHPAIQNVQTIFREKEDRLYHWSKDSRIPADNNLAERELRPLVIARKVSFGSQSERGAETREILMTIIHTLRKRTPDVAAVFGRGLDRLAEDPSLSPYTAFFNPDSS